jgi:hypothetical protein
MTRMRRKKHETKFRLLLCHRLLRTGEDKRRALADTKHIIKLMADAVCVCAVNVPRIRKERGKFKIFRSWGDECDL